MNTFNGHDLFIIMYIAMIALFGAIAKEINDNAKCEETLKVFVAEVVLHSFSGWMIGLGASKYFNLQDITSITIVSGVGGLFGNDLVKILLKIFIKQVSGVKIDDEINDNDKNKNNESKP